MLCLNGSYIPLVDQCNSATAVSDPRSLCAVVLSHHAVHVNNSVIMDSVLLACV